MSARCPECGGEMFFDYKSKHYVCKSCGIMLTPVKFREEWQKIREELRAEREKLLEEERKQRRFQLKKKWLTR